MFRKLWRAVRVAVAAGGVACLLSCGGVGFAPISGLTAMGAVTVSIAIPSTTVATGTIVTFTATVLNSSVSGVQWEVDGIPGGAGIIGTIDTSGNYTAPQFVPNPATVTITAVADADNTKSASAKVSIVGALIPATVTLVPTSASLQIGTQLNLTAGVTGPADTSVVWEVNGVSNGNSTVGKIVPGSNDTAVYTAPASVPNPPTVTIKAVSHAEAGASASCVVTVSLNPPNNATVTITPVLATVQASTTFHFTASVTGVTDTSVYWEVNGEKGGNPTDGNIASEGSNEGIYTAPPKVPLLNPVTVTAVSTAQPSKTASATVTISPPPVNPVTVQISGGGSAVEIGSQLQFCAEVGNSTNTAVTWEVNQVTGGNSTYGTIVPVSVNPKCSDEAIYTPPLQIPPQNPVVISAVPAADPAISATVQVTIQALPITVTVTPPTSKVTTGDQEPFSASLTNTADQTATWYVNGVLGGDSTNGTIVTGTGLPSDAATYTAPATVPSPSTVTIKAVSHADPTKFGTATVTVTSSAVITVTITPSNPQNVQVNDSAGPYTATVTGTTNQSVNWAVNGVVGGNSTLGTFEPFGINQELYIAPATIPNPATVEVTAISVADPSAVSNQDAVTIQPAPPPVVVTIDPLPFPIIPGGNEQVSATVTGVQDQTLTWSLTLPSGVPCTVATCGSVNPVTPPPNNPTTYNAPLTIPTDPYFVNITATSNADMNAFATAQVEITQNATASISINPAQPQPIQAGSGGFLTFTLNVINAPSDVTVDWTMGCISEAPIGFFGPENCGVAFGTPGLGTGCISANGINQCLAGALQAPANDALTYTPPPKIGTNFVANSCTNAAGVDGIIPIVATINETNCNQTSCTVQVCVTVTPAP